MGTLEGDIDSALEALLAQHRAAADWACDLAQELEHARARMEVIAKAVNTAATLLPEPARAQVAERLATHARAPLPGGTKASALRSFLRLQREDFTPTDLAQWLSRAGHGEHAPRAAARMLHRAAQEGRVVRIERGLYRAVG